MANTHNKCKNAAEAWLGMQPRMGGGIKIYFSPACDRSADRIRLSNGTRVANEHEIADRGDGPVYEHSAKLPREPWRSPTKSELQSLVATEVPRNMATSVAIVKLPYDFSPARRDAIRTGTPEAIETNLVCPLQTICELREPLHRIGPNRNPANLKTVTFNDRIGRYNGLHVDSWDPRGLDQLHLTTNRVCVNIGESDRYLLFLPFSLMDIAIVLAQEMGPSRQMPRLRTVIGREFMERFPELPVVRCRLSPGEAYIAPTENLVHDGSSVGQRTDDEQFTIRGHIRLL